MPSKTRKNLPPPYPVSLHSSSGIYFFTTNLDTTYTCNFSDLTSRLSPVIGIYDMEVFDFELNAHDPISPVRKTKDERVSATVIEILQGFFVNSTRILTYVCDSSDGRAKERQTLFRQWHSNIADTVNRDEVIIDVKTPVGKRWQ